MLLTDAITYSIEQHANFGEITVVAGAAAARHHLAPLRTSLTTALARGAALEVRVDFTNVALATGSYIKACLGWLIRCGQLATQSNPGSYTGDGIEVVPLDIYVTIQGTNKEVQDEINMVLRDLCLPCIDISPARPNTNESLEQGKLIGHLDKALRSTLAILCEYGPASAPQLHEQYPQEAINVTGWNNRLAELHRLRLAQRVKSGRQWIYHPIVRRVVIEEEPSLG